MPHKEARGRNVTNGVCLDPASPSLCKTHNSKLSCPIFLYVLGYCCFHRFLKMSNIHYFSSSINCFCFHKKRFFFSFLVDFNFSFGNLFRLTEVAWIRKVQRLLPAVYPDIKILPLSYLKAPFCVPSLCGCVCLHICLCTHTYILTPISRIFFSEHFESKLHILYMRLS